MKNQKVALLLLVPLLTMPALAKQKVDWQAIEKLPPGTHIYILISVATECAFQKVTADKLFCTKEYPGSIYKGPPGKGDQVFNKADIYYQCDNAMGCWDHYLCVGEWEACYAYDPSSGVPTLIAAAGAGGGWHPGYQPNSFAGVKLGIGGLTMDLQYDRLKAQNGFSIEGSGMIPVLRVPRWRPKNDRLLFRLHAEPGVGYRAGGGPFGGYSSGKVLVLIGNKWVDGGVSPYIEFQRRFPFNSPLDGDNRITFGFMWALCEHCGLD